MYIQDVHSEDRQVHIRYNIILAAKITPSPNRQIQHGNQIRLLFLKNNINQLHQSISNTRTHVDQSLNGHIYIKNKAFKIAVIYKTSRFGIFLPHLSMIDQK